MAVDDYLAQVIEDLRGTIARCCELKKLRRLVEKAGRVTAGQEIGVRDQVDQKRQVGLNAADAKFLQAALHAAGGVRKLPGPGRDLHQQRIVKRRDHRTRESTATVETHARATRRTIAGNAAVVRQEAILGVFGRNAALNRVAARGDRGLGSEIDLGLVQPLALGDQDLALHDVDPGDDFGHRVLDLDAG